MSSTLYIIGNGFDLYHGAQSSYWAFRQYLLRCAPEVVMAFDLYWGPRTLLNTLFEHENCVSIKSFYYQKDEEHDNYSEITQNISRNFTNMQSFRDKVVNKTLCEPMPQI